MDLSDSISPQSDTTASDIDDVLVLDRRKRGRTVSFLGLDFAPMSPETLFDRVKEAGDQSDAFVYLVTPNVDQMVRLHAQTQHRSLYEEAWANVNDSRILELLAGWSNISLPACPGSSLARRVFEEVLDKNEPIVVIGCTELVIETLKVRFGFTNLRWHEPPMGLKSNPDAVGAAVQFCLDNPARFTFICVGSPQQEMVARAIKLTGRATGIGLCVGASLEFLAGTRKRAPVWMQNARLEWLFRLMSEPKVLWRRYLVEGPKIFSIWWKWRNRPD
jgi:N-acetylglucosaminyldiphosphoundecaprenol N-acetyl-beta-D-mannosaminyltransferase